MSAFSPIDAPLFSPITHRVGTWLDDVFVLTGAGGVPIDLSGWTFELTIRKAPAIGAVARLSSDDGTLTVNDLVGEVTCNAPLPDPDAYEYDLLGTPPGGHPRAYAYGPCTIVPGDTGVP